MFVDKNTTIEAVTARATKIVAGKQSRVVRVRLYREKRRGPT